MMRAVRFIFRGGAWNRGRRDAAGCAVAVDRGTLRLHYLQKPIGYERYAIARDGGELQLTTSTSLTAAAVCS